MNAATASCHQLSPNQKNAAHPAANARHTSVSRSV
jgi:hypothetical protein